jgi:cytochrome P450
LHDDVYVFMNRWVVTGQDHLTEMFSDAENGRVHEELQQEDDFLRRKMMLMLNDEDLTEHLKSNLS